jgi:hypothetical protein
VIKFLDYTEQLPRRQLYSHSLPWGREV